MRDAKSLTLIFSSALVATVNFVRKKRWKLTGENLELGNEESRADVAPKLPPKLKGKFKW